LLSRGGSGARSARAVSWVRYPARRRERVDVQLDRFRTSKRNLLLAALPAKDFALLAPHLKETVLEQGVVLQEQGNRIDQVYFPHDGIISLLAVLRHGDAIETAMRARSAPSPASARAAPIPAPSCR